VGKLHKSTDGGLSFHSYNFQLEYIHINNLYVEDNLIFFGDVVIPNGIFYSTDYGFNWENIKYYKSILSFAGNEGNILASSRNKILYTINNGLTWDSIPYPNNFYGWVKEIEFDKEGRMFFGTSSQGLYEVDLVVSVEEDFPNMEDFFLYPPYPNPFNSTVTVKFNLPKDTYLKLKIYNILGEEVKTFEKYSKKGINLEMISFDNLAGGIYLIAIEGKDFFAVRKAAFIK
jgi:hypothetical protein